MKNLLLKIIFAGLALGLMPQAAAMNSTHDMQLRSRARSNSIGRANSQPACISLAEIQSRANQFTESEDHDFANLDAEELDRKRPGSGWRSRIKIWDKIKTEEMYRNSPPAKTRWTLAKDYAANTTITLFGIASLIYGLIGLFPQCPPLNPTYKEALQINTRYTLNGQPWACTFDSNKYGTVMPIDLELQEIINSNFVFMQLESVVQDGPTCAKYAFSNMAAIDQLYRDGKSITAETIAEQMRVPLNAIGLPGQIAWKPIEGKSLTPKPYYDGIYLIQYSKIFFPQDNLIHWDTGDDQNDFRIISQMAIDKIKKHGIVHIFTGCALHATAFSIIKEGETGYRVIYMNSHNTPLSPLPALRGWDSAKKCYLHVKNFIKRLQEKVTPNQPALILNDAAKN